MLTNVGLLKKIKELEDKLNNVMPVVGEGYIQFAGSPLPGDTLLNYWSTDITSDFSLEERNNCKMKNTIWKIAVRNGDFLRQEGTRTNDDSLTIDGGTMGEIQEDQFQGHKHSTEDIAVFNNQQGPFSVVSGIGVSGDKLQLILNGIVTDGINGTPRIGAETRPVNTAVRFWVRVA